MKSFIKSAAAFGLLLCMSAVGFGAHAKNFTIVVNSDPEDAEVYLNGTMVANSTPAVIEVDKKTAAKTMIIQVRKEGYENKSATVSYTAKQLKANPVLYLKMKKKASAAAAANRPSAADPTVTVAESRQRVDRHNPGTTGMEQAIIRWFFDSDPRGARIFWRVISSVPAEVKNTNETYLTTTPLEETRSFNIQGLTYNNSRDVTVEIKVSKRGYEDQVKRFNVRQALDQQEISGFFELVPKETEKEE
ncbi:MAG: PEGA domain-containing protein [Muribaculaceae bacterium]|nr:PEGA domain-containing protein [Muribaculaceae bacterium]